MKVVVNACYGGFGLSHAAVMRYAELHGYKLYPWLDYVARKVYGARAVIGSPEMLHVYSRVPIDSLPRDRYGDPQMPEGMYWSDCDITRNDPILVQVVTELGEAANGQRAQLKVVEIAGDVAWKIEEYDGLEHIAEQHRTWG